MSNLTLPATSENLILSNVTIPSGYVNYFLVAYSQMAASGESTSNFLVRQVVSQSVERYAKFIIGQDYDKTIASGELIQKQHGQFAVDTLQEQKDILSSYGA